MIENKKNCFLLRFISAILTLAALFLGVTWKNGSCFGDKLFENLGLPAWSNVTTGTHYPAIVALIMLIAAFVLFLSTTKENGIFHKLVRGTIIIVAVILLLSMITNII